MLRLYLLYIYILCPKLFEILVFYQNLFELTREVFTKFTYDV